MRTRITTTPYRDWSWYQRVIERIYRLTHRGQIRTLVVRNGGRS